MAKSPSKTRTEDATLDQGIQLAAMLNRSDKIALISAIEALLQVEEDALDEPERQALLAHDRKIRDSNGARGRIESKLIPRNGKLYGPYDYLRWWSGGVYKSSYLGKCPLPSGD